MKKLLALTLASMLMASPALPVKAQTVPLNSIAATVDEDVILKSEFDRAMRTYSAQLAAQNNGQMPPEAAVRKQVMERLVMTKLQVARAQGAGISVSDDDVMTAINAVAQQNGWTIDQLRANIEREGLSFPDYQLALRDELYTQRLQQSFAQQRIAVSEAEVDNLLKNSNASGTQLHLANILVTTPEGATADQIAAAERKIREAKAKLDAGADFATVAMEYSTGSNALQGGDLGWRSANEVPSALVDTINGLRPGQASEPVRGANGFQILKLVDVRDGSATGGNVTQYKARHILIHIGTDGEEAARARAATVRERLTKGQDFAKVAKDYSQDVETKGTGGDLGWFDPEAHGPEFATALSNLANGAISEPVRTQAGFHIIQRQDMRTMPGGSDALRAQARESIGRRKLEDEWNRFLRTLRNDAFVQYMLPGFEATESTSEG